MGWFSKNEDYDINSSKLGDESPNFSTKCGMSHKSNSDNSSHTTYWDADSNTRVSYDRDARWKYE